MNETEDKNKPQNQIPEPGVFITKGMRISIPQFSIRIDSAGKFDADPVALHTEIDLCPFWLDIAYDHLLATEKANKMLLTYIREQNDKGIGIALENEFLFGMQAIMSSVIAIDSFYGSIKDRFNISDELVQTWKKNKTARYKQVGEVIRLAFNLNDKVSKNLREALKQNFHYRDLAVHPQGGTAPPQYHPDLNKATDWRYVTFRFYNAKVITGLSISIIVQTSSIFNKVKNKDLNKYCEELYKKVNPLAIKWAEHYEKLFG